MLVALHRVRGAEAQDVGRLGEDADDARRLVAEREHQPGEARLGCPAVRRGPDVPEAALAKVLEDRASARAGFARPEPDPQMLAAAVRADAHNPAYRRASSGGEPERPCARRAARATARRADHADKLGLQHLEDRLTEHRPEGVHRRRGLCTGQDRAIVLSAGHRVSLWDSRCSRAAGWASTQMMHGDQLRVQARADMLRPAGPGSKYTELRT